MRKFTEADRKAGREARKASAGERAGKRVKRVEAVKASLEELGKDAPAGKYTEMVRTAASRGRVSLTTLVKLKCLDCSCWQRVEVRECTCTACPLHAVRPYQHAGEGEEEGEEQEEGSEEEEGEEQEEGSEEEE
jgi:hypothetical protein